MSRAFVLGGGVAGLTAAFGLRDRGYDVVLLESRGWLGGRAFSSRDAATGWMLDNGPHVMLGCYRAMRALLQRLGTEDGFQQDRTLTMAYRGLDGRLARLVLARLPVPLAMPFALLRLPFGIGARLRALRGMTAVLRAAPKSWTLGEWLRRRGQTGAPDAFFWRPLCRAVMNVEPDDVAAEDFLVTLREAFLGSAAHAAFWVPKRPWSELVGGPAAKALAAAGVVVRTGARIAALPRKDGAIVAIELVTGERVALAPDDLVVSALPWHALQALVPLSGMARAPLQSSPITSAFVETLAGAATLPDDGPVTALVDGDPFHFVLRTPGGDPRRFALLSGGSRAFDGKSVDAIAAMARAQIARHYPGWNGLEGAVVRIRKEQHATFVAAPGSAVGRPAPERPADGARNLRLCGDWTATGLPATLEGAARSAERMLQGLDASR